MKIKVNSKSIVADVAGISITPHGVTLGFRTVDKARYAESQFAGQKGHIVIRNRRQLTISGS